RRFAEHPRIVEGHWIGSTHRLVGLNVEKRSGLIVKVHAKVTKTHPATAPDHCPPISQHARQGLGAAANQVHCPVGCHGQSVANASTAPVEHSGYCVGSRKNAPTHGKVADRHREINPAPKDRKSTRLNSSHYLISYAISCL